MWGELSSKSGASCLGASFMWGELSWGELSLGRVVLIPSILFYSEKPFYRWILLPSQRGYSPF